MTVSTREVFELLKASEDFRGLPGEVLQELAKSLRLETIQSGSKFIEEGADANSLFLLVSGRLRVSRTVAGGSRLMYNEVLPGDLVGETSMILRQLRTADISATRESVIAILDFSEYETLVKKYPVEFNRAFSHAIYRQLRHERQIERRRRAQSFYVFPIHDSIDMDLFCQQLYNALSTHGKCEVLETTDFDDNASHGRQLDKKESANDYLIFKGSLDFNQKQQMNYEHSDQLILVADGLKSADETDNELKLHDHPNFELMRRHLALVFPESTQHCGDRSTWNKVRKAERVYPVKMKQNTDFERLARFLLEKAIGLVLGGGGARGFAHLGILKAFEEANIPVDIIGGNSMGALIGASYTAGIPRDEIHTEILKHSKSGMQLTVPLISILSNTKLSTAFQDALGDLTIENLWTPFFAAACNLSDAETVVLDSGPLWRAVLASNSPAGLFPPVVNEGNLLVDGAILENVPVKAMRQRLSTPLERRRGNGLVIAVDVDVKRRFAVDMDTEDITPWQKVKSHFNKEQTTLPGIVDILLQVAHIGGLSQREQTKRGADIYFEPPLSQFKIMDYKKAEQIIQVGYEFAQQQIDELRSKVGL